MGKIFKRGLLATAPLALTIALISWLYSTLEDIFRTPIKALVGENYYFPGLGIIVAFICIFAVGAFINNLIAQKLSKWLEKVVTKIPFVKTLYTSLCDLMNYFRSQEKQKQGKVVTIEIGGVRLLGLITREDFEGLPEGIGTKEEVMVYIPMSYQIGGFSMAIHRSKIQTISMSVEEGMRFAIMAGALGKNNKSLSFPNSEK